MWKRHLTVQDAINHLTNGQFQDFIIREEEGLPGFINLLGIESPGLTSALAIGEDAINHLTNGQSTRQARALNSQQIDKPRQTLFLPWPLVRWLMASCTVRCLFHIALWLIITKLFGWYIETQADPLPPGL
jgi:hypothetical protein